MHHFDHLGLAQDALAGHVAIVTGGGQGIGREVSLALAGLGAKVVIAEISDTGAETERLIRAEGGSALYIHTDVSSESAVAELAERTRSTFGPASILVNNAIVAPVARVMELARGRGTIVNMVSTDAMHSMSAYIASKQGLVGLSQSLAAEVGDQGVRVVALAPGFVATPGLQEVGQKLAPRLGLSIEQFLNMPLHKGYEGAMPVEDAGAATAYLIAALADELHGEVVTGYDVLERAGVLPGPGTGKAPTAAVPYQLAGETSAHPTPGASLAACGRLQEVITQVAAEFGRLPIFIRPLARSGFKKKAILSVQDWGRALSDLANLLRAAESGGQPALATLTADLPRWDRLLAGLSRYCHDLPEETARFTRDEAMLREVARIAAERIALIRDLSNVLRRFV